MQQQPHHRKFIEGIAFDQRLQVHRQVGRLHQREVVVQQPQPAAANQQPPIGIVIGIEAFLQAAVGGALAPLLAELGQALIEQFRFQSLQDQRH